MAISFIAIATIAMGVAEIGFMFRAASVANSATRSSARVGAARYAAAGSDQTTVLTTVRNSVEEGLRERGSRVVPQELWIYKSTATGSPQGGFDACGTNCVKYTWNGTGFSSTASGTWATPDACGLVLDSIGVLVKYQYQSMGWFMPSQNKAERTVMRLEPKSIVDCPSGE